MTILREYSQNHSAHDMFLVKRSSILFQGVLIMTNLLYTQTIDRHTLNLNTIKSSQLYLSSMTYMTFIMLLKKAQK